MTIRGLGLVALLLVSSVVSAEHAVSPGPIVGPAPIIGPAPQNAAQILQAIEGYILLLEDFEPNIPDQRRLPVARRTEQAADSLNRLAERISRGAHSYGEWVAAVGQDCVSACRATGRQSTLSPEGSQCVSGEVLPTSAAGVVPMTYGCWPGYCPNDPNAKGVSVGRFCYKPGQKRDNDRTDITVGCFCR